ncbi:MAG: endonuclease MutS2 [Chlorobi bacterium]|nr:endonuclease MutS2 [Chlorobiota bacterium]
MHNIYPENFEKKTEFSKIRKLIKSYCTGSAAEEKVNSLHFLTDFETINILLEQTSEFKHILTFKDNFPLNGYADAKPYFKKAEQKGNYFTEKELSDILKYLQTVKNTVAFFKKDTNNNYPALKSLTKNVKIFPYVTDKINSVINKHGEIKNNASPELLKIRNELSSKQSKISQTVRKVMKTMINAGIAASDAEVTVRDNKLLIPVESKHKRKANGIIYGESASGKTAYIEPAEVVFLNNEIKELEFAESREIKRILIETTDSLRPYFDDMKKAFDFLSEIDFIRAKALFAVNTDSVKPKLTEETVMEFLSAKHPLLLVSYKNTNKKVIPSDIKLNEKERILIISGPNAGGKSVTLKTAAILQYMLQCGLLIPVKDISFTGIFKKIFIDIGDEQSIENDLSTYSSHLKNMKFFTENADEETLFLIDEFGTGTEPVLGGAVAEAVLEHLYKTKAKGIITTHYTNLKHFATNKDGVANAAMLYDNEKMQPLYKMETGKPGSSFAFEIAEKTGLSKEILNNAKSKTDKNQIDFEKALKQIQQEKRKLKKKKRYIRQTESQLKETLLKYETELEKLLTEKKEILKNAKKEADDILSSANKKIEQTILKIKQKNAEKEQTKQLRKELKDYILKEKEKHRKQDEKINKKIEKLKRRQKNKNVKTYNEAEKNEAERPLQPGDYVVMENSNITAQIISIKKGKAVISSNNIQLTTDINKLKRTDKKPNKKQNTKVNIIRTDTSNTAEMFGQLDIRGKRADDALFAVSKYIDDATVKGIRHIKILHGTGNGILREAVRDYLRSHPLVESFKDERIEAGGAGITLAELDI